MPIKISPHEETALIIFGHGDICVCQHPETNIISLLLLDTPQEVKSQVRKSEKEAIEQSSVFIEFANIESVEVLEAALSKVKRTLIGNASIKVLGLPKTVKQVLQTQGITSVRELALAGFVTLRKLFPTRTIGSIDNALRDKGFKLRLEEPTKKEAKNV